MTSATTSASCSTQPTPTAAPPSTNSPSTEPARSTQVTTLKHPTPPADSVSHEWRAQQPTATRAVLLPSCPTLLARSRDIFRDKKRFGAAPEKAKTPHLRGFHGVPLRGFELAEIWEDV